MDTNIRLSLLTLRFATFAFLWLIMISCFEDTSLHDFQIRGSFESAVAAGENQRVTYLTDGSPFSIKVISIMDSRCPSDVVCVWAGVAHVTFSISGIEQPIDLYLEVGDHCESCSYDFVMEGRLYKLTLANVTPYPTSKNHASIKQAHFSVHAS